MDKHIATLDELAVGVELDAAYDPAAQRKLEAIRAAIALMRGQSWQPIDSAPMDGTRILVSTPYDGIRTSHWEGGLWQGLPWRMARYEKLARPTHWQPLPAPPKDTADEQ